MPKNGSRGTIQTTRPNGGAYKKKEEVEGPKRNPFLRRAHGKSTNRSKQAVQELGKGNTVPR